MFCAKVCTLLPPNDWLAGLKDVRARAQIRARLARVAVGNFGDCKPPRDVSYDDSMALRHVAQAHGMAEVARRADVGDKTLFRSLSENGNPTLTTVHKVLHAVGLRLRVAPAHV